MGIKMRVRVKSETVGTKVTIMCGSQTLKFMTAGHSVVALFEMSLVTWMENEIIQFVYEKPIQSFRCKWLMSMNRIICANARHTTSYNKQIMESEKEGKKERYKSIEPCW